MNQVHYSYPTDKEKFIVEEPVMHKSLGVPDLRTNFEITPHTIQFSTDNIKFELERINHNYVDSLYNMFAELAHQSPTSKNVNVR